MADRFLGGFLLRLWAQPNEEHCIPITCVGSGGWQKSSHTRSNVARKLLSLGQSSLASTGGSQTQGGHGCYTGWSACLGQLGPRLNGALCGQQSHLFPAPPLPSRGTVWPLS